MCHGILVFMEKYSAIDKVVGKISEKEKDEIIRTQSEIFNDQIFAKLRNKEREKTPEELKMITLANQVTNRIRQQYHLGDFDIPAKNIHIVK